MSTITIIQVNKPTDPPRYLASVGVIGIVTHSRAKDRVVGKLIKWLPDQFIVTPEDLRQTSEDLGARVLQNPSTFGTAIKERGVVLERRG